MDSTAPVAVKEAPSPKSPPQYPDFCGRRRLKLEVRILNREIGFLEEELQSLEGLQPVSRCCKEVEEFVGSKVDPLVPIDKKRQRSCHLWKWLRSALCIPVSLFCCCCQTRSCYNCCSPLKECCCIHLPSSRIPHCSSCKCGCNRPRLPQCRRRCCCCRPPMEISCCRLPECAAWDLSLCIPWKWCCCCCCCCREEDSWSLPRPSCPDYSCGCVWSCPKCTEARLCRSCCSTKSSCITGCLC